MAMRKIFLGVVAMLLFLGASFAADLNVKPLYSDERFPPTDKLHAWCLQNADITLETELDIKEINVVMDFDPEKVDILRILPDHKNRDEKIDFEIKYGEIVYNHKNMVYTPWYEIKIFGMMFNSAKDIDKVDFVFASWSYAVTQWNVRINLEWKRTIPFASVPECDPDVIPPSVTLVKPVPSESGIALDSLFVFEMKDAGKWIDYESVSIVINSEEYTMASPWVAVSGNYLVIQPRTWLPVATWIDLKVEVSDLQVFWWANKTKKSFIINTAAWVVLDDNINPMELKQRSRELRQNQWSAEECKLLQSLQWFIAEDSRKAIEDVAKKIECDLVLAVEDIDADPTHNAAQIFVSQDGTFSLFAVTWWLLFFVTLFLKLHYLVEYKKHKKLLADERSK